MWYNIRMELIQLRQLAAVAKWGTVSKAAEAVHISQSALSRSIRKLEDELGVSLFERTKNSMTMNDDGMRILVLAQAVLDAEERLLAEADSLSGRRRGLRIVTCAPAPLWKLTAELSSAFPSLSVTSSMPDEEEIPALLLSGKADLAIVRHDIGGAEISSEPFMRERLFMQVPLSDPLAGQREIRFQDLAGREIHEYTGTGFWYALHRERIPGARYIEYDDFMVYMNVLASQNPLTFVTVLAHTQQEDRPGCVTLPIADREAAADYRLAFLEKRRRDLGDILDWAAREKERW